MNQSDHDYCMTVLKTCMTAIDLDGYEKAHVFALPVLTAILAYLVTCYEKEFQPRIMAEIHDYLASGVMALEMKADGSPLTPSQISELCWGKGSKVQH